MKKTKTIEFNGRKVTVHELTVAQVDAWMAEQKEGEQKLHTLDLLMDKTLPVAVLRISAPELTDEDLQCAPSELNALYDAVESVNSFLCGMAVRLTKAMQGLGPRP